MARTPDFACSIRKTNRVFPRLWKSRRPGDDSGMTIIEICVAVMIMSVALIGVVGSMGASLSLVGQGRQRSSGTQVAQQAVEAIHNLAYANVALNAAPTHSSDPTNPDYYVSGSTYDPDGAGSEVPEPLYVDSSSGFVTPNNDVTVGNTQFSVYRFVTWVDDPTIASTPCPPPVVGTTCDYKRVVVVVVWKNPVRSGSLSSVTQSTFITDGTVTLAATVVPPYIPPVPVVDHLAFTGPTSALSSKAFQLTVSALDASSNTVTTYADPVSFASSDPAAVLPAPYTFSTADSGAHQFNITLKTAGTQTITVTDTANASLRPATTPGLSVTLSPCPADSTPPTGTIAFAPTQPTPTKSMTPTLVLTATDPCAPITVDLSNDQQTWTTQQIQLTSGHPQTLSTWPVSSGDGPKTVYARFRDGGWNQSLAVSTPTPVTVDNTPPTVPVWLLPCATNGNKSLVLTWAPSTDTYSPPVKYTVTRGDGTSIAVTSASYTDTTVVKNVSYTYTVTAFDQAGNASVPSAPLAVTLSTSLAKC